jgi:hypothetical protein
MVPRLWFKKKAMADIGVHTIKGIGGKAGTACQFRIDPYRLKSSCVPVADTVKEIVIVISRKEMLGHTAVVYDVSGNLLFNLVIDIDTIVLDTGKLKNHSGVVCFGNNYSVYIN